MREPELVELELEVDHLGHQQRVVHGVRQLAAEEATHLLRRLQVELVRLEPQPAGRVEVRARPDAQQQVVRLVLLRHGVVGVVGGQHRDPHAPRQLDELRVEARLLGHAVVLDLDEEVVLAEDGPILVGRLAGRPLVAIGQALEDLAAEAGGVPMSPSLCCASSSLSMRGL